MHSLYKMKCRAITGTSAPSCDIYYKCVNPDSQQVELKSVSLCFVSDDLTHDSEFVFALQHKLNEVIPSLLPNSVLKIHCFSDNCGGQYKNYKIMINLTFHAQDFNRVASWTFFAASHGKSPCDGVGGATKRCLPHESLSRSMDNHIVTAKDAFEQGYIFFHMRRKISRAYKAHVRNPGRYS